MAGILGQKEANNFSVRASVYVCVCVCVCMKDRDRETWCQRKTERDTQTHSHRQRDTGTQTETERTCGEQQKIFGEWETVHRESQHFAEMELRDVRNTEGQEGS